MSVDLNSPVWADFESGSSGQFCFRPDPDGQDRHITGEIATTGSADAQSSGLAFLEPFHSTVQENLHAAELQVLVNPLSHLGIEGEHNLIGHLDKLDAKPKVREILRHLQPNESPAHNNGVVRIVCLYETPDSFSIFYCPKGEYSGVIDTGKRRANRLGARRKHELVVALLIVAILVMVPHFECLCLAVNG